jgi:inorganic pyrophosphatase
VRIGTWGDAEEARQIIIEAIEAAKKAKEETGDDAGAKHL